MIVLLTMIALPVLADDRFDALAQIETGRNDNPRTMDVSRFGISPPVWKQYAHGLSLSAATNPFTALNVAHLVMVDRVDQFVKTHQKQPSDQQWYLLWFRPAHVDQPNKSEQATAERFANLCRP